MWHVIERNSSVADLADLPPGRAATRAAPGDAWVITEHTWADDEPPPYVWSWARSTMQNRLPSGSASTTKSGSSG